jgi:ribosomal 50S subunit-associated protein YjgA (DUF615 family)
MVRKLSDILAERARAEADDRDLRSRSDARRARKQIESDLVDLARTLCALSSRQIERVDLPEPVLEALTAARAIHSAAARNRALRLVRRELRAADVEAIRARLEELGSLRP